MGKLLSELLATSRLPNAKTLHDQLVRKLQQSKTSPANGGWVAMRAPTSSERGSTVALSCNASGKGAYRWDFYILHPTAREIYRKHSFLMLHSDQYKATDVDLSAFAWQVLAWIVEYLHEPESSLPEKVCLQFRPGVMAFERVLDTSSIEG